MTGDQIHYEELAQDALRSVVRTVLARVQITGSLPGEHHFFIAFDTQADGVSISKRLKDRYPEEMTIVLQHQFWDLKADDNHFEVRLSFNNVPELLIVPYNAVRVFFDPSVPYGLQFGSGDIPRNDENADIMHPDVIMVDREDITGSKSVAEYSPPAQNSPTSKESQDISGVSAEIVELDTFRKK